MKTNLFIIGAAKSGTSSLWAAFSENMNFQTPVLFVNKEPATFSDKRNRVSFGEYPNIFQNKDTAKYRCDFSTQYISDPQAASRIYEYNEGAKIICVLRDPVNRLISLHGWMVANGYEFISSLKCALAVERIRKKLGFSIVEYERNYYYLESSKYRSQIEKYISVFGEENILIICFEEMLADSSVISERICKFLGVSEFDFNLEKYRENTGRLPSYPIRAFLYRLYLRGKVKAGLIDFSESERRFKSYLTLNSSPLSDQVDSKVRCKLEKELVAEVDFFRQAYPATFGRYWNEYSS